MTARPAAAGLAGSDVPLLHRYDVALLDLDGVVYLGVEAVPAAPAALRAARAAGMRPAFVTNNASRTPEAVAAHLRELGIDARPDEVVTSAQAACRLLAERLPAGAAVLVVGGEGLRSEAARRGFVVVDSADDGPAAVVQGFSPDVGWRDLAEAAVAVRRGASWVACNGDRTVPSPRGALPGNGSLVAAVRAAVDVAPVVAGKPEPAMHRECLDRTGARHPLVVGDRLDTDIEGASRVGCDSLLVLSGVSTAADLLAARPEQRPRYLAADVGGLLTPHPSPRLDGAGWRCGGWRTEAVGGAVRLAAAPAGDGAALDALRALCAAAWSGPDGVAAGPVVLAMDERAYRAADLLGLAAAAVPAGELTGPPPPG